MQIVKMHCEKCGYAWIPRVENPWKCPRCQHIPGTKIRNKKADGATLDGGTPKAPDPTPSILGESDE